MREQRVSLLRGMSSPRARPRGFGATAGLPRLNQVWVVLKIRPSNLTAAFPPRWLPQPHRMPSGWRRRPICASRSARRQKFRLRERLPSRLAVLSRPTGLGSSVCNECPFHECAAIHDGYWHQTRDQEQRMSGG
jgi:hypothetical protein